MTTDNLCKTILEAALSCTKEELEFLNKKLDTLFKLQRRTASEQETYVKDVVLEAMNELGKRERLSLDSIIYAVMLDIANTFFDKLDLESWMDDNNIDYWDGRAAVANPSADGIHSCYGNILDQVDFLKTLEYNGFIADIKKILLSIK